MATVESVRSGARRLTASGPFRQAAVGTVLGLIVLAAIVAAIAGFAQHRAVVAARADGYPAYLYSLPQHVLAMIVLAGFAVLVATWVGLRRDLRLAPVVVLGAAFGPMEPVAAPIRSGFIAESGQDPIWGWRLAVGTVIAVLLLAVLGWNIRCLRADLGRNDSRSNPEDSPLRPAAGSVFMVVAAVAATLQVCLDLVSDNARQSPLTIVGWSVISGGLAVVVTGRNVGWRSAAVLLAGSSVVPGTLFLAYARLGGWPGVAGWEFEAQSPIVQTAMGTAALLAPPLLSLIWSAHVALSPRGSGITPAPQS